MTEVLARRPFILHGQNPGLFPVSTLVRAVSSLLVHPKRVVGGGGQLLPSDHLLLMAVHLVVNVEVNQLLEAGGVSFIL